MLTTYRSKAIVRPDGRIEITSPNLKPGTRVDVILRVASDPEDAKGREERARELKSLFKETQALPQTRAITEEEIAAEIAVLRSRFSDMSDDEIESLVTDAVQSAREK